MERNRNWQGWVAIVLAGLALIVALGWRTPWSGQQSNRSNGMMWSAGMMGAQPGGPGFGNPPPAAQVAPQVPQAPTGPRFGRGRGGQGDQGVMPSQGNPRSMMGQGQMGRHSHRGGPSIFGIFGMFFGLAKLIAFGLLAWLLLRTFMQRRSAPPAAPPVAPPTTPAGHDPTVE
ncbi:MAG: hypothetical protein WCJ55_13485 [Chloroflexales bacterium]